MAFNHEFIDKFDKLYQEHDACINERLKVKNPNSFVCDRDRFVEKVFNKFKNTYIVLSNVFIVGWVNSKADLYFSNTNIVSKYTIKENDEYDYNCLKPIYMHQKTYLHIVYFENHNRMYGSSYVCVSCIDVLGNNIKIKLDYTNMHEMQFRFIEKDEFEQVNELFLDDREPVKFIGQRWMTRDELYANKLMRKNAKKTPRILTSWECMAKDKEEAKEIFKNEFGSNTFLETIEQSELRE